MSDAPDLRQRLVAHGIDPDLARPCRRCRVPRRITGYDGDRLSFVCQTPSCVAVGSPHVVGTVHALIACDACGQDCRHRVTEMSNGEIVFSCDGCSAVTVMGDPTAA